MLCRPPSSSCQTSRFYLLLVRVTEPHPTLLFITTQIQTVKAGAVLYVEVKPSVGETYGQLHNEITKKLQRNVTNSTSTQSIHSNKLLCFCHFKLLLHRAKEKQQVLNNNAHTHKKHYLKCDSTFSAVKIAVKYPHLQFTEEYKRSLGWDFGDKHSTRSRHSFTASIKVL